MQQHIAPGRNMPGLGVLNFVVADAIFAGDEDHFRRRESRHLGRIVPRVGYDGGIAQQFAMLLGKPKLDEKDFSTAESVWAQLGKAGLRKEQ